MGVTPYSAVVKEALKETLAKKTEKKIIQSYHSIVKILRLYACGTLSTTLVMPSWKEYNPVGSSAGGQQDGTISKLNND